MEVQIRQVEGLTFVAKGESNHWVTIDGPKEFFGSEAAPRPMELLLIALGSCTASDVASILRKKIQGNNLQKEHLERAIELSQNKYCPISSMLRKAVEIKYSYRVI